MEVRAPCYARVPQRFPPALNYRAIPLGRFLNVSAVLHETGTLPVFDSLEVGRLPVPAWFANMLLEHTVQRLNTRDDVRIVGNTSIKKVRISDDRLTITYDWQDDSFDRIKAVILPREDQERLKAYQDRLVEIVIRLPGGTSTSLANLLPPLFELAAERSATGDPVAEIGQRSWL